MRRNERATRGYEGEKELALDGKSPVHQAADTAFEIGTLRALVRTIDAGVLLIDGRGRLVLVNETAQDLLRWPASAALGSAVHEVVHAGRDGPEHDCPLVRVLQQGGPLRVDEDVFRRPDGSPLAVSYTVTPVSVEGVNQGAVVTFHHRTAHDLAAADAQRLAASIAATEDAVIGWTLDTTITSWNPGAERLFGYAAPEAIGRSVRMLVPASGQDELTAIIDQLRRGQPVDHQEVVRLHKDGRSLDVVISIAAFRDGSGAVVGVSSVVRNITEQKRAERELRARARQQAIVAALGQRALVGTDMNVLLADAVGEISRILDVAFTAVLQLAPDAGVLVLRAAAGWAPELVGRSTITADTTSQAGSTLASLQPVIIEDRRTDPRFQQSDVLQRHGILSGVSVPIPGTDRPFGTLAVHSTVPRRFTTDDVHFLQGVANVLAAAMQRSESEARLRDREAAYRATLEQRVAERTRELQALLDVSHNVASMLELGPLVSLILDQLSSVVEYTGAFVLTLEADALRVLDYRGPVPSERLVGTCFPIEHAVVYQEVVRRGDAPVIVDDLRDGSPFSRAILTSPIAPLDPARASSRSLLAVPLKIKDRVIGLLRLDHAEAHAYEARHAALALAFANQAAVALENARLYARAQAMAALEERQRLARDLHDSVTQSLYGVTMYAEAASRMLATGDTRTARDYLQEVRTTSQAALQEMRLLIFELRPPELAQRGLVSALEARLAAVEQRITGLDVRFAAEPGMRLGDAAEEALYRIAQEALNNAIKHAHPTSLSVRLSSRDGRVVLEIRDNGVGFDLDGASRCGGFGLRSIEERAARIGASASVRTAPGAGTSVRVEVPA
jgi:PAS domain S-box-containing protein